MKVFNTLLKVLSALAFLVGTAYLVAAYGDKIVAWAKALLGTCPCTGTCEDEAPVEEIASEEAPVEEVPVEEAPVAEEAPAVEEAPVAEEAPAEAETPVEEAQPVASEEDFQA